MRILIMFHLKTNDYEEKTCKKTDEKLLGFTINNEPVYNCVSNPKYTGGSTPHEDYYRFEIRYIRKRYGAPLFIKNRWASIAWKAHWNDIFKTPFKRAVWLVMQRLDHLGLLYPRKKVEYAVLENWFEDEEEDNVSFITHVLQNQ